MGGGIYLIQDNDQLVEMMEQAYDSEGLLQELLAKYPNLLAGDQMDSAAPRRWLLVSRETLVPREEDGPGWWAVDHLFLDQDAIPTLVEVKRSTDTRIRREVVGQMLDYAANAVVYWPVEAIRAQFETTCKDRGIDPEGELVGFLGVETVSEEFWQRTKTNLQAGKVRMVFVADKIPAELQRVVEFLNTQMDPAEVLAVEIKQYVGKGLKTLVPRVIGQTGEAQQKKPSAARDGKQWDEVSFFHVLEARGDAVGAAVARKILDWAKSHSIRIRWSKGSNGAFYIVLEHKELEFMPIAVRTGYTNAYIEIQFGRLKEEAPFDDETKRLELLRRLNTIPGVAIVPVAVARYPSAKLSLLRDEVALAQFLETLDWAVNEIKAS